MRMHIKLAPLAALLIAGVAIASCSEPTSPGSSDAELQVTLFNSVAPTVVAISPVNGATGVSSTGRVALITFSEEMKESTINPANITLTGPAGSVAGSVLYHGGFRATFEPSAPLAAGTLYTVTVTTGVQDFGGTPLATAFTSSFTTAGSQDNTSPVISGVNPVAGATGVSVNTQVSVTFNEAMDASTITASSVTLTPSGGGPPVGASVSSNSGSTVATLTPSAALAPNTGYTIGVTTSVRDLAGNALASIFASSFTTAAAPDPGAPFITDITPAAGETGVSTTSTVLMKFSEEMKQSTINSANITLSAPGGTVAGVVEYHGLFRATIKPLAALSPGTTYTVNVTTAVQDFGGTAMASPFTSTFTTAGTGDVTAPTVTAVSPSAGASEVATSSTVVVTFSEPIDAATLGGSTFTVTGPSGAVAGGISYNSGPRTATFTPSSALAAGASYNVALTSGITDLAGNPLVAFGSTFNTASAIVVDPPPTVVYVIPADAATGVPTSSSVLVKFNEEMKESTISSANITLTGPAGPVAGVVEYHGLFRATIKPSAPLAAGATYTFNVSTGVQDFAGTPMASPFSSSFTTEGSSDVTAPTVSNVSPTGGATGVATTASISITFSEAINQSTVNGTSFTLTPAGGSAVAASVTTATNSAQLQPSSPLATNTTYTVTVTTGVRDLAGNPLGATFTSSFTTAPAQDVTAPTVTGVTPVNAATGVAVSSNVDITFSEAMNAATIGTATITLTPSGGGPAVSAAVTYAAGTNSVSLDPSSNLAYNTTYTVAATSGAADVAGNPLIPFSSTFTTAAPPDLTAPTVTGTTPANRASEVGASSTARVTFNEPIDQATLTASAFTVEEVVGGVGTAIAGTRSYDATTNTAIFTPSAPYKNHLNYRISVTTGVRDIAGNALAAPVSACFTPTAGSGVATSLTGGHLSGNDACLEVHWHLPVVQTGNVLSLSDICLADGNINCNIAALSEAGRAVLGGASCRPTPLPLPRICEVEVTSLSGSVNGTAVSFTFTTDNGLTFTFTGAYSAGVTGWLTGTISGETLAPVGINWEQQANG